MKEQITEEALADIHLLAEMIKTSKNPVILTGAGISVASGISTFRGDEKGAVWKDTEEKKAIFQYSEDPTEIGTNHYFNNDPVKSWFWYYTRFSSVFSKEPNAAHDAIVAFQKYCTDNKKTFHLVTQNIDGLHRKAGSEDYIEIHGRADRIRCTNVGCDNAAPNGSLPLHVEDFSDFINSPTLDQIPRCPICNSLLRPHVLWFDEYYNEHVDFQFQRAVDILSNGDLLIFIGTSLAVGITYNAMQIFENKSLPIWLIDPNPIVQSVYTLRGRSELVLPKLVEVLER